MQKNDHINFGKWDFAMAKNDKHAICKILQVEKN